METGGVIVLFENLLNYCEKHSFCYDVIDTNKSNYNNKFIAYFSIIYKIFRNTSKYSHISLHGTAKDFIYLAPFVIFSGLLLKKSVSLRKFAGNFNKIYNDSSILKKLFIRMTLQHSSANFFETKYLVDFFKIYNRNTYWFPNVRNKTNIKTDTTYRKRFIFIGAINEEKGIEVLCQASNMLPKEYTIDLYGKLNKPFSLEYFQNYNVNYKGTLSSEEVLKVMANYDVLLLPSYREGYPGAIIEAFSVGLPVIATTLSSIKEMVDTNCGMLIKPGDFNALKDTIISFNQDNYSRYRSHAIKQFENFDSEVQTSMFFKKIEKVTQT